MDSLLNRLTQWLPPPWGDVLDAGSGASSWKWLLQQDCRSRTGVTMEKARDLTLQSQITMSHQDKIIIGNWQDPTLLAEKQFDIVIADYLLGACDRYAPYFQEKLLERLIACSREWLFIIGLEPIPQPNTSSQKLLFDVAQLRDAVQLLSGRRPHRELPEAWVKLQLQRLGLTINWSERYHNLYDQSWVEREIASIELNLTHFTDPGLAQVLRRRCHYLRQQAHQSLTTTTSYSFDYLLGISVRPLATTVQPPD